ncbi:MAG: hypothetical protein V2I36_08340, partial [Desulfopila sp.]|nr:hypothetical protein [Desulfopila sp.]
MQQKNIFSISLIMILLFLTKSIPAATDIPEPPPGNLKYSITVTKFANESSWRGQWTVGDGFTTAMTDLLHQ